MTTSPRAGRPHAPGYGLPAAAQGMWSWAWAQGLLRRAQRYLLATGRVDGRPHVMPVWAVWHEGALWFSTGRESVKHRNLSVRPDCSLVAEDGPQTVVVDGTATQVEATPEVHSAYDAKYAEGMPAGEPIYRVAPTTVFGFSDAPEEFGKATRWRF
jgi:nitroimidazol reductase NimA-like FMN-containing flavoprotein (pyridoxamine 5'-phosphate oxidase superfamily)